jgi:hypothetical protein
MNYYAHYQFEQSKHSLNVYLLTTQVGFVENLQFDQYKDTPINREKEIAGMYHIYFGTPRNPSIRKYFAHTFEGQGGKPITSTESLDSCNRTFGDAKNLFSNDLILFKFSSDMKKLDMYFVQNKGQCKSLKQQAFKDWCNGESFTYKSEAIL